MSWGWAARLIASCGLACTALACQASRGRVPYRMDHVAGLVISSSLARHEAPEPRVRGGRLAFDYPLLAENHGPTTAEIDLVGAQAVFVPESEIDRLEPFRAACRSGEPSQGAVPVALLAPGARMRIDCTIEVPPAQLSSAYNADREVALAVPIRAGGQRDTVVFLYALFAGDLR